MSNSMISPSIVNLLEVVDNRYSLATIASKRARQLIEGNKPLIEMDSSKPVTIAINEIEQKVLTFEAEKEGIK